METFSWLTMNSTSLRPYFRCLIKVFSNRRDILKTFESRMNPNPQNSLRGSAVGGCRNLTICWRKPKLVAPRPAYITPTSIARN